MNTRKELELMAAAVYEIKCLLSRYLGSDNDGDAEVRLAAHLAYALHNEAESIIGGGREFDLETALAKVARVERTVGAKFADQFALLLGQEDLE